MGTPNSTKSSDELENSLVSNCIDDAVNRLDHKIISVLKLQHIIIAALILLEKLLFLFGNGLFPFGNIKVFGTLNVTLSFPQCLC